IRDVVDKRTGKVVVIGPNAAIDAVAAARLCKWDVIWFAGSPAFLPGTLYMDPPYQLQHVPRFDALHVDVVANSAKLDVYYCLQKKSGDDKHERADICGRAKEEKQMVGGVDFVVYGIGPAGSVGSLLARNLIEELQPEHDATFKFAPGVHTMLSKDLAEYVAKREKKLVEKDEAKERQLVEWAGKSTAGKAFLGLK